MQAGLDDYLTKPVDLNRFNSVLKRYLKDDTELYSRREKAFSKANSNNKPTADFENDPEFLALVSQFRKELPSRIKSITNAARDKNWAELKNLAHKLKGLGTSFGYPDLSDISAKIQTELNHEHYDKIDHLLSQLEDSFNRCIQENRLSSNF